ncbi:MAG: hypothetical protein ACT4P1_01085 [Sporichthyaceae bacterium]
MSICTHSGPRCRDVAYPEHSLARSAEPALDRLTVDMLRRGIPLTLLSDLAWPAELTEVHQTHAA